MKICFVLPQILRKPIGGYKMVYEYANRLSAEGHDVAILYLNDTALSRFQIPHWLRILAVEIVTAVEPRWFVLDKKIKKYSSTSKRAKGIGKQYTLVIATGADTVEKTSKFFPRARKAYFIQGYEKWIYSEKQIHNTFALGMDNIVVADWLKVIVDRYAKRPAILLRNPIDTDIYKVNTPIENRNPFTVGVLYHTAKHKGFQYAYEAILRLKEIYPKLRVQMFGTSQPAFEIPSWIKFTFNASQKQTVDIYNNTAVFLCATVCEGYGLTGLEAMACGAALVSTEYDGVKEYAVHGENALLSPVYDTNALVRNAGKLIKNQSIREKIALNGIKRAKEYSWKNAMAILNNYIDKAGKDICGEKNSK